MNQSNLIRLAALGMILSAAGALAQSGNAEAGEIGAYAGLAAGSLDNHPTFGGDFGRAFSQYWMAIIDTSYIPLGARTLHSYPGIATTRSRLYDFNFSMHIRVPVNKRWEPYAIVGAAFLYNTFEQQVIHPDGAATLVSGSHPTFGFETGAGARYYAAEDWGVRGEYRYTFSNSNFSRILFGVFYQFNGDFPFRSGRGGRRRHGDLY